MTPEPTGAPARSGACLCESGCAPPARPGYCTAEREELLLEVHYPGTGAAGTPLDKTAINAKRDRPKTVPFRIESG